MSEQSNDDPKFKRCNKCGVTRVRTQFYRCSSTKDGLRANCKSCVKKMADEYMPIHLAKMKDRRAANREKYNAYSREYYRRNLEENRRKAREDRTRRRKENLEVFRAHERHYFLLKKYGISTVQYNEMFKSQDGKCAICGSPPSKQYFSVDHCHDTGRVRSLLCVQCNVAIGLVHESRDRLLKIIDYLDHWHSIREQENHNETSQTQKPHHAP